jgi:hypothetical protein
LACPEYSLSILLNSLSAIAMAIRNGCFESWRRSPIPVTELPSRQNAGSDQQNALSTLFQPK